MSENTTAIEEAKSKRTSAKGRFTRKRNFLIKSIISDQEIEVVETNYANLAVAYDELEDKHETYVELLPNEQSEEAEAWMTGVQEKSNDATDRKIKYVEQITLKERRTRQDAERQGYIDRARPKRNTARAVFEASYKSISHALKSKEISNFALRDLQTQIEDEYLECRQSNAELLQLLSSESAEAEMNWIATIQTCYHEIKEKIVVSYTNVEEARRTKQESTASPSFLRLEKVRMPHFDEKLREYPQFKKDFQKQVMTQTRKSDAAYVLRTCLDGEPAKLVKSVDDDIDEMWQRLDEKYGDPAKVTDVIIDEIKRFIMLREGEDKRFIAGPVDVLIGYEYAACHPEREQNIGHFVLLKNRFGRCVGGTHPLLKEMCMAHDLRNARVNTIVSKVNIDDFYTIEALGVQCKPKCGGCKCGKCSLGAKDYSIQEERELELIERNLTFNSEDNRWTVEYPWIIKDPNNLPDNRKVTMAKLAATERRLRKNADHAKVYDEQIKDMVARNVARKLDKLPRSYALHCSSRSAQARIQINSCPYSFQQQRELYGTRLKRVLSKGS